MKKKQLTRERIFRNNKVVLTSKERTIYAQEEYVRQVAKYNDLPQLNLKLPETITVEVDIYDPFISVKALGMIHNQFNISGFSKRMPNDVPNDRIAIQVAVSRLIKRLKND